MNRCAVVIGVNKTGGLPPLQAAVSDAEQFADWAQKQGIAVKLLTDANGSGVSLADIKKEIKAFVDAGTFSQMIVYFSGHGVLRGPDYELWLLSGAPTDPNEAVNVPGSITYGRNVGIPHLVIISDACRSAAGGLAMAYGQGSTIFPYIPPTRPPEVDTFYATRPGDPAYESQTPDMTRHGIFTQCLLEGLNGSVPEVIVQNQTKWVVPSRKMKTYLVKEIPDVAAAMSIQLQQFPDIRVESCLPDFLAEVDPPAATRTPPKFFFGGSSTSSDTLGLMFSSPQDFRRPEKTASDKLKRNLNSDFRSAVRRLIKTSEKKNLAQQIRTGFTVIGTELKRASVIGAHCDTLQEQGAFQIRVHEDPARVVPQSLLLEFSNGCGIALAILPGFIGTVVVEDARVVNVSYRPSQGSNKFDEYEQVAKDVESRRAHAAVAARNGKSWLQFGKTQDAHKGADYLRVLKSLDPTLGLYAAYAYAQAGDFKAIGSVYEYMDRESEPILFDVALLARKLPPRNSGKLTRHSVAPFCPMLTQGWAFLDPYQEMLPDSVREAGCDLIPGLWTMFGPKGMSVLWSAIQEGRLQ